MTLFIYSLSFKFSSDKFLISWVLDVVRSGFSSVCLLFKTGLTLLSLSLNLSELVRS